MKWNNLNFIILLIASLTITSCVESKSNKKSSSDTSTTQSTVLLPSEDGGNSTGDNSEDESHLPSYYQIPVTSNGGPRAIIVHGTNTPTPNGPLNGVLWSSNRDSNMSEVNRQILVTDSKFELRMKPISHSRIQMGTKDSNGFECSNMPMKYTKLNIDVCIRKQGGGCLYSHYFNNLSVEEWSLTKEFTIPANTNDPLIIDVNYITWDGSCIEVGNPGYGSGYDNVCPYDGVWGTQCVGFEMEVSTDGTKSLPGGRY